MQKISFTPQNYQNAIRFKAGTTGKNYDPKAGMPRSKDSYVSTYKVEQEKKQEKLQKTSTYALVGIAFLVALSVASTLLTHKNNNRYSLKI